MNKSETKKKTEDKCCEEEVTERKCVKKHTQGDRNSTDEYPENKFEPDTVLNKQGVPHIEF